MLETNKNNSNKLVKPSLSSQVTKWVWIFSVCTSLLINPSEKALANLNIWKNETYEWNNTTEIFKQQVRNEITLSINWLVKAIELKQPELINNEDIKYHSSVILKLLEWNIENNELNVKINLNEYYLSGLKTSMESVSYLLNLLYWEWYADILSDWKDHSDKDLIIEIMDDGLEKWIQRMSIKNSSD